MKQSFSILGYGSDSDLYHGITLSLKIINETFIFNSWLWSDSDINQDIALSLKITKETVILNSWLWVGF